MSAVRTTKQNDTNEQQGNYFRLRSEKSLRRRTELQAKGNSQPFRDLRTKLFQITRNG